MALNTCKTLISLFHSVSLTKPPGSPPISTSISAVSFSPSSTTPKKSKPKPTYDHLTTHHNFPEESALEASSSTPFLSNPENFDSVVSFLKENGFKKNHIIQLVKNKPVIFNSRIPTIKAKLQIFQELEATPEEIADLFTSSPWLFKKTLSNSIPVLKTFLGSNSKVFKALKKSIDLVRYNLEKTLMPNVEFLKSCGVSSSRMKKFVFIIPLVFLVNPELLRETVKRVDALGIDKDSSTYLYAVYALNALPGDEWEKKVEVFRSLGFSDNQILSAFKKKPVVFVIPESKIRDKCRLLLRIKHVDASFISKHPGMLALSTERRLRPRLMVYEVLERKQLFERKKPKLTSFLNASNQQFVDRYVVPYFEELGDDVVSVF